jgi:hypothetical protein
MGGSSSLPIPKKLQTLRTQLTRRVTEILALHLSGRGLGQLSTQL